ncbi:MAG: hypothetical protein ABI832_23830 [bacterium]|jgi:hypothetical protein
MAAFFLCKPTRRSAKWQLMLLRPGPRKILLVTHIGTSVGLMGAVAGFLLLAVTGLVSPDPPLARSVYPAMDLITRLLILPLVLASLGVGVVQSLVTPWGLFRHWWIVAKLGMNLMILAVLLVQMPGIRHVAAVAASSASLDGLFGVRASFVVHATGGLLALGIPLALSVFKPRGLTRYGWRRQTGRASGPET